MNTRTLGTNGPEITEIGFGAWAIGGPWEFGWGSVDDTQSIKAIRRGLDLGINWIDTAAAYGLGHSEEVVGRALEGIRDRVFVATKCGMIWDDQRRVRIHLSSASIRREMDASLKRLQTDHVDLYQFHWPDPETPVEESWATLVDLQKEGKTRFIGVCNFDVPLLNRCQAIAPVQSLQPPYSLLRRDYEKVTIPYCQKEGIGIVAYSPMQSGLLTGKFDPKRLAPDDWRRKSTRMQEPYLLKAMQVVDHLRPIAEKYHKSVAEFAIAWVLMNTAVTAAIVGARTDNQIGETVGGSGFMIEQSDMNEIETVLKKTMESPHN
jgi:aryl-alcohol dehydrogenase-like predicted oxidoreductase